MLLGILVGTYVYEVTTQYVVFTDGTYIWRKGTRDGAFVIDKAITPLGFEGIENTDWINLKQLGNVDEFIQYVILTEAGVSYRKGVRAGAFVLDVTLTATGFDGVEDDDWINIKTLI